MSEFHKSPEEIEAHEIDYYAKGLNPSSSFLRLYMFGPQANCRACYEGKRERRDTAIKVIKKGIGETRDENNLKFARTLLKLCEDCKEKGFPSERIINLTKIFEDYP